MIYSEEEYLNLDMDAIKPRYYFLGYDYGRDKTKKEFESSYLVASNKEEAINDIAKFVCNTMGDKLVCNLLDLPVLDTFGCFINKICDYNLDGIDKFELLSKINEIQMNGFGMDEESQEERGQDI